MSQDYQTPVTIPDAIAASPMVVCEREPEPLPPLPTPFVDRWQQRTPWLRIALLAAAIDLVLYALGLR